MTLTFGEFLKSRRAERRVTLRAFSEAVGMDPANYSKIERGVLAPPKEAARLEPFRRALDISADSEDHREMMRLAALGRGEIPAAVLSNEAVAAKLPLLFRTLEGNPVDEAMLDELVAALRRE